MPGLVSGGGRVHGRRRRRTLLVVLVQAALALAGMGAAGLGPASDAASVRPPPLYLGLDSYLHLGRLSYLEIGDRVGSESAADRSGSNSMVHDRVLLHVLGTGIVTSMRMRQDLGSPWRVSADGRSVTVGPAGLGHSGGVFPYPLTLAPAQSEGSSIVDAPVPFRDKVEITASSRDSNFDGIYRQLPYGTALPADSTLSAGNPAIARVAALLGSAGTDIAPAGLPSRSGTVSLGAAGTPATLATIRGQDQIRSLSVRVPLAEAAAAGNATLRIYWDGQRAPAVSAPLKYLAGDGAGVYQPAGRQLVRGLLANITSDGLSYVSYNLYYPMPFASDARIVLVPGDSSARLTSVGWSASYQPFGAAPAWWGYFHANYTTVASPPPGRDMTFLDYRGSGKLVGTVVNFGAVGGVLEGGPQIFTDNSRTPQIAYTGSEEWGLGGDYWDGGTQVSLPLGGLPSATNNPPGAHVDGAALYRFLIADSIPFNSRLVVDWEHGGVDEATTPYRASMMWYGTPRRTAVRTDQVVPGNRASASAHNYRSPGRTLSLLTAAYEYQPFEPLSTATVATMHAAATFTMKLAAGNAGAFLRRTFDSCVPGQRAKVYVDGTYAGTWFDPGVSSGAGYDGHLRCWRDEDYPLPAALTAGKKSVTIRIQTPGSGTSWTASDYKLYSFVS